MIVSTYYNKENGVYIASTTSKGKAVTVDEKLTKFVKGDDVVAVNYFIENEVPAGLFDSKNLPEEVKSLFAEEIENPFEVGLIESIESHPKSTKLNVCQVRLNSGVTQIVCGASNVSEGIKVVVAKVGAVMPSGMNIVPSKLIDVESNGMICSLKELGREQEAPGIVILNDDYTVGQDYL